MKRTTVTPNLPVLLPLIKEKCRSYVVFTKEIRGKDKSGWVTEWGRGSNYPSPEEAARMCILLNTTPEEILLHEGKDEKETAKCQKDIELVRKLLENEKGIKETPDPKIEGVDDKIVRFLRSASVEELMEVLRYIEFLESKRGKS